MENPIDNIIDLGLVNYVKHPTNPNYIVFRFADLKRANSFEETLKSHNIWFEKGEGEKRNKPYYLFGIHKNDYKKVEKFNYLVEAKHKKPFIPFKAFRYLLMIVSFSLLTLAILGYCSQQNKLNRINNTMSTVNR